MLEGETVESLEVMKSKVGLVLGVPSGHITVPREWALGLATMSWPFNISIMHMMVVDKPISQAREIICEQAVSVNAPYVWFVDDDTVPPHTACRELLYQLSQHPEAVACGGIYCERRDPTTPIVYKEFGTGPHWDWKVGETFEVQGIGTGCLMIRVEMLKNIPKPWFRSIDVAVATGDLGSIQTSDDMYFCKKAVKAGYKILAHGGVLCDHYDRTTGKAFRLPLDSRPYQKVEKVEQKEQKEGDSCQQSH